MSVHKQESFFGLIDPPLSYDLWPGTRQAVARNNWRDSWEIYRETARRRVQQDIVPRLWLDRPMVRAKVSLVNHRFVGYLIYKWDIGRYKYGY